MIRSKAVVLQILTSYQHPGPAVVTAEYQPDWAAESGIIVGYQGRVTTPAVLQRFVLEACKREVHWELALICVRPRPPQRTTGSPCLLEGLTLFDTKTARVETRQLMGQQWRETAVKHLREHDGDFSRLNGVDFTDPRKYIPAFPECAAPIFRSLPNLDAIIGLVKSPITNDLAWVAMTPVWKIADVTEEAFTDGGKRPIVIRAQSQDGSPYNIALPGKRLGPRRERNESAAAVQQFRQDRPCHI